MKVLILHPPMYPVNFRFYDLLAKSVDLTVIQFGEHPKFHTSWHINKLYNVEPNFKLIVIGKGPVSLFTQLRLDYLKNFINEKPDIVLSIAFWFPSIIISLLKLFFDFKFIILTNVIKQTESEISIQKQIIRKLIAKNVDVFIAASAKTKKYLNSRFKNLTVIVSTQTIDVKDWKNKFRDLPKKNILRHKLNFPIDKKIMLGIGNFTKKKNWEVVLNSLESKHNIFFVLIGSGPQRNVYNKIIKKHNLFNNVRILEKKDRSEIIKYYKASDFLIFPSLYDQFGFVVAEALTLGIPVLCSKNSGASVLIKDGYNGFLIDPKFKIELMINKIIENLDFLKKNSSTSISEYTLENRVKEFLEIFRNTKNSLH